MINSFKDLKDVILSCKGIASNIDWNEHGQVNVQQHNDLILFSYMRECQYKKPEEWNWFERVSRGLVMDTHGEVVARPFDKFWNYGGVFPTGEPVEITEKVDGSLGIIFYHKGSWQVCTRGSFTSEQAIWAQGFLWANYDLRGLDTELTLLCEIIYPENQIVIDYRGKEDLVLLGVRNRNGEGDWWSWGVRFLAQCYGFNTPKYTTPGNIEPLLEKAKELGPDHEGWVVRYSDGTRVKVKGSAYLELHKWISNLTPKAIAKAMVEGEIGAYSRGCPSYLKETMITMLDEVMKHVQQIWDEVKDIYEKAPKSSRKEFALWVKENSPKQLSSYLFLLYDDKLTTSDIYKREYGV